MEKIYSLDQIPENEGAIWANLVNLMAIKPKKPDLSVLRRSLEDAEHDQKGQEDQVVADAKEIKGKEVEIQ